LLAALEHSDKVLACQVAACQEQRFFLANPLSVAQKHVTFEMMMMIGFY
jgi:hypothetical protein